MVARCADMEEAKVLMYKKDIYGILEIPENFSRNIALGEQAHVSLFCDMGALLNYKALLMAGTDVALQMSKDIQIRGMEYATKITEEIKASPVKIQDVKMFNPQGGFTSFLIPGGVDSGDSAIVVVGRGDGSRNRTGQGGGREASCPWGVISVVRHGWC